MGATLPEPNSSSLKIGHPKRKLEFQPSIFRGELLVLGSVFSDGFRFFGRIWWNLGRPSNQKKSWASKGPTLPNATGSQSLFLENPLIRPYFQEMWHWRGQIAVCLLLLEPISSCSSCFLFRWGKRMLLQTDSSFTVPASIDRFEYFFMFWLDSWEERSPFFTKCISSRISCQVAHQPWPDTTTQQRCFVAAVVDITKKNINFECFENPVCFFLCNKMSSNISSHQVLAFLDNLVSTRLPFWLLLSAAHVGLTLF